MISVMRKLIEKLKHEIKVLIPVTLFFFVSFQLLALTQALMLKQYGIHVAIFVEALIGALIVSKVVVITDHLTFVNRFPEKPLIYNVLWKTFIYVAASVVVRYAEHLIEFLSKTGDLAEANHELIHHVVWPHFWVVQLWLFVLLLVYCSLRELIRVMGREEVIRIFFHAPQRSPG